MTGNDFDHNLAVRINKTDLDRFKIKCRNLGKSHSFMIREIIKAFNDDRVRIIPTDEQKESLNIYKD